MRVPILPSDLPGRFNKVAKYIGRHWPEGKIGLSQSRERLAYLLGYNSVYEVSSTAATASLPGSIELSAVHASILAKALFKYGVSPDKFDIVYRLPFVELAFFSITDVAKYQNVINGKKFAIVDEFGELSNYKTHRLIIEQDREKILPPYKYAVRPDGMIFSSSHYASILSRLGDLSVAAADVDVSEEVFIRDHVTPLAWRDLDSYLSHTDENGLLKWRTPFKVQVNRVKYDDVEQGFVLFHAGVNAYYPYVLRTPSEVIEALSKLFHGDDICDGIEIPATRVEISCSHATSDWLVGWYAVDMRKPSTLYLGAQEFCKTDTLMPYSSFFNDINVTAFEWPSIDAPAIDCAVIDNEVLVGHMMIDSHRYAVMDDATKFLSSVKIVTLSELIKQNFENHQFSFKALLAEEYGTEYVADVHDIERWRRIGNQTINYHPELHTFGDVDAIGYLYSEFEGEIYGRRYVDQCLERNVAFIAFVISRTPTWFDSQASVSDAVFAMTLCLTGLSRVNSQFSNNWICASYRNILMSLEQHRSQSKSIKEITSFHAFYATTDPRYLTHGDQAQYQDKSLGDAFQRILEQGRKLSTVIEHTGLR